MTKLTEGEFQARVLSLCVPDERRPFAPSAAVWSRGLVFTCERDVVRVIDPADGKVFRLAGGGSDPNLAEGPAKLASFRGVSGLALDEAGLWFGDTGGGAVRRIHFASDTVSTLAEGLPGPVHLVRADATLYVACREGELFEIDTSNDERRALEAVRSGEVTGVAIIGRTLYVTTASGWIFGVDRTSGKVTQRMELDAMPHSVVADGPRLYVALPGRIEKMVMPDGASERITGGDAKAAVAHPRALAIVKAYNEVLGNNLATGLYFFGAGALCWLDFRTNTITPC